MKRYSLSLAGKLHHNPEHPERTALKPSEWNYIFQVWPNRESMAKSIRMQQKRAPRQDDWRALVPLNDIEGYGRRY